MNERRIQQFFQILAREIDKSLVVILTGAAAGTLWGSKRQSQDIDFAIRAAKNNPTLWKEIDNAVQRTVRLTGIAANYAEDIDRWGMISLLDYGKQTSFYRRFGPVTVRLMDPRYWAIGKLTRLYQSDIEDIVAVFKRQRPAFAATAAVWAKALKASPKSTALFGFKNNVEHFIEKHGKAVWGSRFDSEAGKTFFRKKSGIQ
jgi:hypothetical protein